MCVGIEWTFSYGSDYLFLDFAKFVNVFLGCAAIDGEAVDKVRVHH